MNVADNLLTKASPRRKVFIILKNLLVLQKSPDIDPPPGRIQISEDCSWRRNRQSHEVMVSISDGPKAVKVDSLGDLKTYL